MGIKVGDTVQKVSGYKWPGIVVAEFETLSGKRRIVVECTVPEVSGALHIYAPEQLSKSQESTSGTSQEPVENTHIGAEPLITKAPLTHQHDTRINQSHSHIPWMTQGSNSNRNGST